MPTDTRSRIIGAYCLHTGRSYNFPYTQTITFSGLLPTFIDYDSRTYVQSRRRGKGWVPPKPYSREIIRGCENRVPGYSFGYSGGAQSYITHSGAIKCGSRSAVPSFDGDLVSQAIIGARLKVKDSKVNFAVSFAEAGRTRDMVANSARRIAGSLMDIRKGDFKGAAERLGVVVPKPLRKSQGRKPKGQEIHNSFLEYKYGWLPVLSDVRGAAELLAERDLANPDRYMSTVKSRKSLAFAGGYRDASSTDDGIPIKVNELLKGEHSAFVRLDYCQRHPMMSTLARAGFTNPALIAWELVPLSFVADWIIPIGNYCSLLDSDLGWDFLAGSLTKRTEAKWSISVLSRPLAGWDELVASGSGVRTYKSVQRTIYTTAPTPGFIVKNPLTGGNLASALSLLAQACGKR